VWTNSSTPGAQPETTWIWDTNGNLLCTRGPAANQVKEGCITDNSPQGYTDGIQVRGGNSSVFSNLIMKDVTGPITVGFDARAKAYGTGLQGMRDRLEALGGTLEVSSTPGRGTTVTGSLPAAPAGP
jgi:hypothetical protein